MVKRYHKLVALGLSHDETTELLYALRQDNYVLYEFDYSQGHKAEPSDIYEIKEGDQTYIAIAGVSTKWVEYYRNGNHSKGRSLYRKMYRIRTCDLKELKGVITSHLI